MSFIIRPTNISEFDTILPIMLEHLQRDFNFSADIAALKNRWNTTSQPQNSLLLIDEDVPVAYGFYDFITDAQARITPAQITLYHTTAATQDSLTHMVQAIENRTQAPRLIISISGSNRQLQDVLLSQGFEVYLTFLTMQHQPQATPYMIELPKGITIRQANIQTELEEIYKVDETASRDKGYHQQMTFDQWQERMHITDDSYDPSLWFVALKNDNIVGVALNSIIGTDAWIDHLGVLMLNRKRGIGTALLQHSLNALYATDHHTIKLSLDAGSLANAPNLYHAVDFETVQKYDWLEKIRTP